MNKVIKAESRNCMLTELKKSIYISWYANVQFLISLPKFCTLKQAPTVQPAETGLGVAFVAVVCNSHTSFFLSSLTCFCWAVS